MSASRVRTPVEARPPRMEALARLPVFFALAGKRAVLAGGTPAAAWKAELLSAAGAEGRRVRQRRRRTRCSRSPPSRRRGAITASMRARGRPTISPAPRSRSAPSRTTTRRARFAAAARAAGVPVNVIDKPAFCDFSFGSIVNRSPLVIGISTDGAAPVFAQAIRAKLEAHDPARLRALGGGGAALARRREIVRPVVRRRGANSGSNSPRMP